MDDNPFRHIGLQRLASEHGLDTRPTILRVATDLFCQISSHTPADRTRYSDLALALLESADRATKIAVARKLAPLADAPEAVITRLLNDPDPSVSREVLSRSPQLRSENFADFLLHCGPVDALAIAQRPDLDARALDILVRHESRIVVEALLENTSLRFDSVRTRILAARAANDDGLAELVLAHPGIEIADLAPLYQKATPELRVRIRQTLEQRPAAPSTPSVSVDALNTLNHAVQAADRETIGIALGKALSLDPAGMDRIVNDPTGEVLALALSAAGIKRTAAINLILIAGLPEVRTSIERVFAAADAHETTSRRVAREIVAAIAGERRQTGAVFEPHMHASTSPQRTSAVRRPLFSTQKPVRRREGGEQ